MSDYMKEAERLLAAVEAKAFQLARGVCSFDESREARAALLAHIQRGAVPDGWQVVPKEPTEEMLTAASLASMQHLLDCINDPVRYRKVGSEEITRNTHASRYRTMLAAAPATDGLGDINVVDIAQAADATRETAPAPAEVPMPEPVAYVEAGQFDWIQQAPLTRILWNVVVRGTPGDGDVGINYSDQMRTYGNAREAAGYAHAIEVIKRLRDSHQTATGECQSDCDFVAAWDSAIDALREEVKP